VRYFCRKDRAKSKLHTVGTTGTKGNTTKRNHFPLEIPPPEGILATVRQEGTIGIENGRVMCVKKRKASSKPPILSLQHECTTLLVKKKGREWTRQPIEQEPEKRKEY